jgi:protocatechuate 3,4-dioxygenase beta subunit
MRGLRFLHIIAREKMIAQRRPISFVASAFLLVTLAFFVAGANAQSGRSPQGRQSSSSSSGNSGAPQSGQRGQSSVSGRVISEETGEPVSGARVRISSSSGSGPAGATVTNARGEFRFDNLAAGEYHVIATPKDAPQQSAVTFAVPLPSGDRRTDDAAFEEMRRAQGLASTDVTVDGTNSATIEVRVPRQPPSGSASGRILYADGKPAANAQVTFLNRQEIRGRRPGPTRLNTITDEHGFYQIGGLPPGEYIVSARLQEPNIIDRKSGKLITAGLVILTYYPSATSARAASPVAVAVNQETSDVNITLVKRSTHTLSGTLHSRTSGRSLSGIHVRLRNRDDLDLPFSAGSDDRFIWTDAQGRFTFSQVMDGDYVISVGGLASPPAPRGLSMGPQPQMQTRGNLPPRLRDGPTQLEDRMAVPPATQGLVEKQQEVTVAGADINNLVIEVSEGGRVSGTVTVEGNAPLPPRIIVASEMKAGERRPDAFARVNMDGSFEMSGVPDGPLSLDVIISPPGRLYVKSITAAGVDLMHEPPMIGDGTSIRDVRIVLSAEVATLTGRVLSSDGTPLRGATVMLVPADQGRQRLSRGRLIGVTGPDGRFMIGAAPGEYLMVIWTGQPPSDEAALKALAERAPRVSLQAGEQKVIELAAPEEK